MSKKIGDVILDVNNISLRFGGVKALTDISFNVREHEIRAIIGPNGAGKSTLLSVISRLLTHQPGTVSIAGADIFRASGSALSRKLAVLRQDNTLSARLTVRELVSFGRYPHSKGRLSKADRAAVNHALGWLDLCALGPRYVLMKGGHGSGAICTDLLVTAQGATPFSARRPATRNTHGTGCTLSAAIAAGVAQGLPLVQAVGVAHRYLQRAIAAADDLHVGSGHGPVHHFHHWWDRTDGSQS